MLHDLVSASIAHMHGVAPEAIWLLTLIVCFAVIVLAHRFYGATGLIVYICVAIIAANVQVTKLVDFAVFSGPIPLGTLLFTSTFLATDILREVHGAPVARRAVWLGFLSFLCWTGLMILTLGFASVDADNQQALSLIFTPTLSFFLAGMAAYLISQYFDVWFYGWLARRMRGYGLWLRNNLSTWVSSLIDNTVFSLLAWYVFTNNPVALGEIIGVYIFGTYLLRVVVAICDTPFIYLACRWR
ncbi:MAG: queuosine precursor transporter [Pseudomonadota bacterium]